MDRSRMDQRRCLLEIKKRAGLLSNSERHELSSMLVLTGDPGGGVLVTPALLDVEAWLAEHGGEKRTGADRPSRWQ